MKKWILRNLFTISVFFLFISLNYSQTVDYISDTACLGNPVNLTVVYSGISTSVISQILWDTDGDGSYDENIQGTATSITFDSAGAYNIGVRIIRNDGGDPLTNTSKNEKKVIIRPLPVVDFITSNLCPGVFSRLESTTKLNSTSGIYLWDINNNSIIEYTDPDVSHKFQNTSTNVKLKVINSYGCADSIFKLITLNSNPAASFEVNEINCPGDTAIFSNQSSSLSEIDAQYIWKFGDNTQDLTEVNPRHVYTDPGTYSVSLAVISQNGCKDTIEKTVQIPLRTKVEITASKDTVYYGETSILDAGNNAFSEYIWSTGETESSIIVNRTNEYSVIATDNEGCISKDTINIVAFAGYNPDEIIAINNIISPNSDKNRYLEFYNLEAYGNCELTIYSQWGFKVFYTGNYNNDWDGKNENGSYLQTGTYFYVIRSENVLSKGSINIIR